jgi:hypothetical protein
MRFLFILFSISYIFSNNIEDSLVKSLLGNWMVDVNKSIEEFKKSPSYLDEKNQFKEFQLLMMQSALPEVKYTFFDNGNVKYSAPITSQEAYLKTIWEAKDNNLNMVIILRDFEDMDQLEVEDKIKNNFKFKELKNIFKIIFIDSEKIKLVSQDKENSEIYHLIKTND